MNNDGSPAAAAASPESCPNATTVSKKLWKVIGGEFYGGILVRHGSALSSKLEDERLSTAAVVQELGRDGDRLQFQKVAGVGPKYGWVSLRAGQKNLLTEIGEKSCVVDLPSEPRSASSTHGTGVKSRPGESNVLEVPSDISNGITSDLFEKPLPTWQGNLKGRGRGRAVPNETTLVPKPTASRKVVGAYDDVQHRRRMFVLRHGSRPDNRVDPPLDLKGMKQAEQVADFFANRVLDESGRTVIKAIYSSPFLRALQTAVPIAKALQLKIRIEWGFCELLAHNWLQHANPLPALRQRDLRSFHFFDLLDHEYESTGVPEYPDVTGRMQPGDQLQRMKALRRHKSAVTQALSAAAGSILIVGHGATHDFVPGAVSPFEHPERRHTPYCVPHCGITTLEEDADGWHIIESGALPWKDQANHQTPSGVQQLQWERPHRAVLSDPMARVVQRHSAGNLPSW